MTRKTLSRRVQRAASGNRVVGGYTRLSQDRDGNKIGPEIQRRAIQQWADAYGYTVLWYEDPDVTAANSKIIRPEYERMLSDLRAGVIVGIVVWRIDRLVRITREFERCAGVVEDAHGFIADVTLKFSTENEMGKLILRLLVLMAEMEIAAMKTRQLAHQQRKAEQGRYSGGGYRPFGFVGTIRNEKDEIINRGDIGVKHDAAEVTLLRDAGRRVAWEGHSYADICRDWGSRTPPVVGTNGKPWEVGTLSDVLTGARIGGFRETEEVDEKTGAAKLVLYKAEWEPVLDLRTWEKLRAMRKGRPNYNSRPANYLFIGGTATCGRCQHRCVGATRPKDPYKDRVTRIPTYRCDSTAKAKAAGACSGISIDARPMEDVVLDQLFERLDATPSLFDTVTGDDDAAMNVALERAHNEVAYCDNELAALSTRRALPADHEDHLEEGEWKAQRAVYRERKAAARKVMDDLRRAASFPTPYGEDREHPAEWFEGLSTLDQKRAFVRAHIRSVVVLPATRGSRYGFDPGRVKVVFADAQDAR